MLDGVGDRRFRKFALSVNPKRALRRYNRAMLPRRLLVGTSTWVLLVGGLFALDRVRVEIRSDQASAKYGVTGKGVIFAMIDRGID